MGPEPVAAVLVLADEDDCSFPLGDPEWPEGALTISPRCYSRADELVDTDAFARELIAVKGSAARVRVGTIVGGRWLDDVQFAAEACRCNSQHEGAVPVNNCRAMRGNSIASQCGTIMPSPYCPGLRVPSDGSELCCTGDPAHRYLRFARRFPHVMESICQQTYSPVLARLADLAR